jgi:hypothetical protein
MRGAAMKKLLQLLAAAWVVAVSVIYYLQYADKFKALVK